MIIQTKTKETKVITMIDFFKAYRIPMGQINNPNRTKNINTNKIIVALIK